MPLLQTAGQSYTLQEVLYLQALDSHALQAQVLAGSNRPGYMDAIRGLQLLRRRSNLLIVQGKQ